MGTTPALRENSRHGGGASKCMCVCVCVCVGINASQLEVSAMAGSNFFFTLTSQNSGHEGFLDFCEFLSSAFGTDIG